MVTGENMDKGEGRGGTIGEEEVEMGRRGIGGGGGGGEFVRGRTPYYMPTDEGTSHSTNISYPWKHFHWIKY